MKTINNIKVSDIVVGILGYKILNFGSVTSIKYDTSSLEETLIDIVITTNRKHIFTAKVYESDIKRINLITATIDGSKSSVVLGFTDSIEEITYLRPLFTSLRKKILEEVSKLVLKI